MLVSAACSLFEACLLSMSNSDIADVTSKNPKLASIWRIFKGNIQKPISVILIINTISHTTGASISGAQFDKLYGPKWIALFSLLFSFAMIQWTEILPKTLGVKFNKQIAKIGSRPLFILIKLFNPIIKLIEFLNKPFINKKNSQASFDPAKEISLLSRFAFLNNLISKDQEQIISRTIGVTNKKAKAIMIPIKEVKFLNAKMSINDALIEANVHNHTRYPLFNELNNILGYINFKDIVSASQINDKKISLKEIVRPIISLNENDCFSVAFKTLTNNNQHIAIVKNDNNALTGLITLEDIIEEVLGEIEDEYDMLPSHFYPITNNRYIVGGGISVSQLNDKLATDMPNLDMSISNWIKSTYGTNYKPGSNYSYKNINFIIKKIRRLNINEVIIERV